MALRKLSNQGAMWGRVQISLCLGHPARAIDEIIERLDLRPLQPHISTRWGNPPMTCAGRSTILIYSYMRGITSSRAIAQQCEENIVFQFLTGGIIRIFARSRFSVARSDTCCVGFSKRRLP